jgi:Na+/melibiose symporter-like transporter
VFLINVPVVVIGLAAVIALVPESRAAQRPGLDLVGVAASAAGLVALTYGLIQAGQDGWGDASALALMIAGVALLVGFFGWERRLTRRPGGQPLIDLSLFGSASFTWGVILAVVPILCLLGILFTMPQYFQGVLGTTAMGSGLRLLPLVGGLVAGAVPAARIVRLVGAKVAVTAGFVLLAAGLVVGAMTSVSSGGLYVAAWLAVAGLGTGIAMATAMSAALVELSAEKSGAGSAVLQAVNKTGGRSISPSWAACSAPATWPACAWRVCRRPPPRPSGRACSAAWRSLRSCTRRRCSPPCRRPSCTAWTWRWPCPPASPWRASSSP